MKTQLSLTIVAYRNYDLIKAAVESIEKHTSAHIDKTIFISDNSAWDSTAPVPQRDQFLAFLRQYSDVVYIDNQANLGFGKGHNVILDHINSEYHAIVNPDIVIHEDVFSAMTSYLTNNPGAGMVIPKIVDANGTLQAAYREYPTVWDMFIRLFFKPLFPNRQRKHTLQHMDYSKPFEVPFAQGCFLVIRTALFKSLNGFDDRFFMYMEDADLCRRVNQCARVMYCPDASVVHAWSRSSHKDKTLLKIHIQSMIRYFNKWGWALF